MLKLFLQTSKCISKFIFNEKETSPNLILKNTTKLKHIFYMTTVSDLNTNYIYIYKIVLHLLFFNKDVHVYDAIKLIKP